MKTIMLFCLMICLSFGACRKSNNDCVVTDREMEELTEVQDAILAKSVIYAEQQTPETCRDFRNAYQDYIDLARQQLPCWIPAQRDALEEAINDAEESLHELDCE